VAAVSTSQQTTACYLVTKIRLAYQPICVSELKIAAQV